MEVHVFDYLRMTPGGRSARGERRPLRSRPAGLSHISSAVATYARAQPTNPFPAAPVQSTPIASRPMPMTSDRRTQHNSTPSVARDTLDLSISSFRALNAALSHPAIFSQPCTSSPPSSHQTVTIMRRASCNHEPCLSPVACMHAHTRLKK